MQQREFLLICKTSGGIWGMLVSCSNEASGTSLHTVNRQLLCLMHVSSYQQNKSLAPSDTWNWRLKFLCCLCGPVQRPLLVHTSWPPRVGRQWKRESALSLIWRQFQGWCYPWHFLWGSSVCSLWASCRASHIDSTLDMKLGQQCQQRWPVFVCLLVPPSSCINPLKFCGKQYRGMLLNASGMSLLWQIPWK